MRKQMTEDEAKLRKIMSAGGFIDPHLITKSS
jgi:hypothetical protein